MHEQSNKSLRDYPLKAFRLCIDENRHDVIGRIYMPMISETILFKGWSEVILKMDRLYDEYGYPQAFQEKRSFVKEEIVKKSWYFGEPERRVKTDYILSQYGTLLTANVTVRSRRNTSWQGELFADDGTMMEQFESEIELMAILDRMINQTEIEVNE